MARESLRTAFESLEVYAHVSRRRQQQNRVLSCKRRVVNAFMVRQEKSNGMLRRYERHGLLHLTHTCVSLTLNCVASVS